MCGDCVLDKTAGICPVTTCPKGLLNGPCGGMWDGKCEVLADRECTHVQIKQRLAEQGRSRVVAHRRQGLLGEAEAGRDQPARGEEVSRLRDMLERGRVRHHRRGRAAARDGLLGDARERATSCRRSATRSTSPTTRVRRCTSQSLAASRVVLDNGNGCEPIFQQTCRDRNRLALQSDLLAAWTLGLENVLVVTGDDPRGGDHPQAKGVFDLDSTLLLEVTRNMNDGVDMNGTPLDGGTDFFIGGALFPEAEPWDIQLERAYQKIEAGAVFFQTQAIIDIDKFARAAEALKPTGAKIIAGVLLLKSPRVIKFINERLAGLMVPDWIADRITQCREPARRGDRDRDRAGPRAARDRRRRAHHAARRPTTRSCASSRTQGSSSARFRAATRRRPTRLCHVASTPSSSSRTSPRSRGLATSISSEIVSAPSSGWLVNESSQYSGSTRIGVVCVVPFTVTATSTTNPSGAVHVQVKLGREVAETP